MRRALRSQGMEDVFAPLIAQACTQVGWATFGPHLPSPPPDRQLGADFTLLRRQCRPLRARGANAPGTHTSVQVMIAGSNTFNVDNVRVNKIVGGSFEQSALVNGMVTPRDAEGERRNHGKLT